MLRLLYNLSLALSLSLHVFNMGGEGGFKPFYIPALVSCVFLFVLSPRKTKLFRLLMLFLLCAFISTVFSTSTTAFPGFLTILIVALSCYGVAYADMDLVLRCMVFLIPFDLVVLIYEAITNSFYRFQGFYNDPNYLCTTLLVMLFLCIVSIKKYEGKVIKITMVASCVIIFILILLSISRTGLACSLLLLLASLWDSIKKHLLKVVICFTLLFMAISYYASDLMEQRWDLFYERVFDTTDNVDSASSHRGELSIQNLRYISDNPQYLFFGLGAGTTSGDGARQISGLTKYRKSESRDHNTWTSSLSEQGLFALLFFSLLFINTFRSVYKIPKGEVKYCSLGLFVVLVLFSFSLWQMSYLPFWWGLFLLNNKKLQSI